MRLLGCIAVLIASTAFADGLDPGAPEGAERTASRTRGFDSYPLPVGPFGPGTVDTQELSGKVVWSGYRIDENAPATSEVMAIYKEKLAAMDLVPLFECSGDACGGFDFRFGAALLPPPAMLLDVRDFAQLSAGRAEPEGYLSIFLSRVNDKLYIQTVTVVPGEPEVELSNVPTPNADTESAILPGIERALLDRLLKNGHVPVDGLAFASGGATLTEDSEEAIELLARMLSRDADLRVAIVGHSDNDGGLDANIALSTRRAQAVMQGLIARGVPQGQLEARGIGYLSPVTSNATPEGKARNRRVELVLRAP